MVGKIIKTALAVNGAAVVRLARFGPQDAASKLRQTYYTISPFESHVANDQLKDIREVNLSDVVGGFLPVKMVAADQFQEGSLPLEQLLVLLTLLCDQRPEIVMEIGTFFGSTTKCMAINLPSAAIHTVDLPLEMDLAVVTSDISIPKDDFHLIQSRQVGEAFAGIEECSNIVQHYADTATWDFSPAAGASFFFIDGSHTYEYVKNDTLKCMAVCAPRARFVWHDCDAGHPDVVRFLHEFAAEHKNLVRVSGMPLAVWDYEA